MRDELIPLDQHLYLETKGHKDVYEQFCALVLYERIMCSEPAYVITGSESRPPLEDRGLKDASARNFADNLAIALAK